MKPLPWLLDVEPYPWHATIEPRFGDVDSLGHLNNVALAQLFEETRVRFNMHFLGSDMLSGDRLAQLRLVVAQTDISYLSEGGYPDTIDCAAAVSRVGNASYEFWIVLRQRGRPLAFQRCVLVVTGAQGPAPLPAHLRQALQALLHPRAHEAFRA